MMKLKKEKKQLAWYWLSIVGAGFCLLAIMGGMVGSLMYLAGLLFFIVSLIEAGRGGFNGKRKSEHISIQERLGAFVVAVIIMLAVMGTVGPMMSN